MDAEAKLQKYRHRLALHGVFVANDLDWVYNRHHPGPGADARDAPTSIAAARRIAADAVSNGCEEGEIGEWLREVVRIIRYA